MNPWDKGPADRRTLFRESFGSWIRDLVEKTEDRILQQRYVRPPGALPEVAFLAACSRCGECSPVCPVRAIRTVPTSGGLAAGTPYLEVASQPCVACADMPCVRACPTGALQLPANGWTNYRLGAVELVPERCVTFEGSPCRVCVDACPMGDRALALDAGGHPVLKREGCVGCGVCVRECITSPSAFLFHPLEV
ncbi:MAG: 4Fe-4S dicluster domain-containing protein [Gemmatimonadales bacterium]